MHQHWFREGGSSYVLTAVCGVCDFPILVHYLDTEPGVRVSNPLSLIEQNVSFPGQRFKIVTVWPRNEREVPENLPDNVATFFGQGLRNEKAQNWDAAGAMFRKSLDVATKILDPSHAHKNLFQRIEALENGGRLTSDLAAWAHEVRIDGNAAVHDDEPETPEDVAAIHEFARAVLLYTFTFPALVASRTIAIGNERSEGGREERLVT